ncbi:hypothetical protein QUA62_12635 [Microcoleus sp. MON1_C1]|uniref:hypothetical protein n=1 Tax=Microcoleus sp. MON1_C1 TaxID=2818827 RepID=UPI002FD1C2F5
MFKFLIDIILAFLLNARAIALYTVATEEISAIPAESCANALILIESAIYRSIA